MKIFKYPIYVGDLVQVEMLQRAKILCVQMQGDMPCVWALVDERMSKTVRKFRVIGTGHDADDLCDLDASGPGVNFGFNEPRLKPHVSYVGTFQQAGGTLVWHVFDLGEAS
jgi:hypothetical protein